jgi:ubiquitin-conjugating enzyme E2 Z
MSQVEISQPVITQDTIKRITRDIKNIMKNPLHENGIYYQHNMENIFKGYAMIIGPSDTPYQDGFYFFEFNFPYDYPHSPPVLTFLSNGDNIRFNPNLYRNGKVCISLLNTWKGDQWTSCQSISSILLTLCTVLNENPLLNEPGITESNSEIEPYNIIISYKNNDVCILSILDKIKNNNEPFSLFKDPCIKHFKENKERILKNIDYIVKKAIECTHRDSNGEIRTHIYKMSSKINKTQASSMKKKINNLSLG